MTTNSKKILPTIMSYGELVSIDNQTICSMMSYNHCLVDVIYLVSQEIKLHPLNFLQYNCFLVSWKIGGNNHVS